MLKKQTQPMRRRIINIGVSIAGGWMMSGCAGPSNNAGLVDGILQPCPSSPNCVSSQAKDQSHRIDPLPYIGTRDASMDRMAHVLTNMPRTRIITRNDVYIHAVAVSKLFRFRDDVEVLADDSEKVLHIRSASRVGYSDLGVNRRRVEAIQKAYPVEISE